MDESSQWESRDIKRASTPARGTYKRKFVRVLRRLFLLVEMQKRKARGKEKKKKKKKKEKSQKLDNRNPVLVGKSNPLTRAGSYAHLRWGWAAGDINPDTSKIPSPSRQRVPA